MQRVDYDKIACEYDRRYETNRFDGLEACMRDARRGTPYRAHRTPRPGRRGTVAMG
jgi:hypothetical protein